ncbi:hypothetical protein [Glycomyces tarimensis]
MTTTIRLGQTITLVATWTEYAGGPGLDLDTEPSITITTAAGATIVAETVDGVAHAGLGTYTYSWTVDGALATGDYLAQWAGTASGQPVQASELITVLSAGEPLVTEAELEELTGQTISESKATLLLNTASGVVRNAVRQHLTEVIDDVVTIMGTTSFWLDLPERPVTAVTRVAIDGDELTAGTDYKRVGNKLWRRGGWRACPSEPSEIEVTYTHGWPTGDWRLETARSMVMTLAANKLENILGAVSESIDDYRVRYAVTAEDLPEHARANLVDAYAGEAGNVP